MWAAKKVCHRGKAKWYTSIRSHRCKCLFFRVVLPKYSFAKVNFKLQVSYWSSILGKNFSSYERKWIFLALIVLLLKFLFQSNQIWEMFPQFGLQLNPSLKQVCMYLSRFCHTNDDTHLEEKISVHIISHSFKFIRESLCVKSQMSSTNFEIELCALLLEIHGM